MNSTCGDLQDLNAVGSIHCGETQQKSTDLNARLPAPKWAPFACRGGAVAPRGKSFGSSMTATAAVAGYRAANGRVDSICKASCAEVEHHQLQDTRATFFPGPHPQRLGSRTDKSGSVDAEAIACTA